ncbi:molecular chaperone [Stenotrophomonas sp. SY1]|uniref:fimbrial biogenesis chaperone n=1 Tax=Stenotrophomonas sp. SY1 TaxID=477235 RepID=UPI001E6550CB|nr:molecular chaperone [Stenotrophomonas sp. SY1]MCD9086404.1 molecular chaperone [Stenotrophomonas sp. SY1]
MHNPPLRKRITTGLRLISTAIVIAGGTTPMAAAGTLQVAPIMLEFEQAQVAHTLWLSNSGPHPLRAQVRVQQWQQVDGQEQLQSSTALLASPPMSEIGPGQRQLVRIVREQTAAPTHEQAFRLIVDELPDTRQPDSSDGLQFLLRHSIPVFVLPAGVQAQLSRADKVADTDVSLLQGSWQTQGRNARLTLHNNGASRIRISQLSWLSANGHRVDITPGLLGYVLAGQQMRWTLSLPEALATHGTLHAKLNDDAIAQILQLAGTDR